MPYSVTMLQEDLQTPASLTSCRFSCCEDGNGKWMNACEDDDCVSGILTEEQLGFTNYDALSRS